MDKEWRLFSDRDIYSHLIEAASLDDEFLRLMLIELLSRIKKLEQINFALQAVLMEKDLIDSSAWPEILRNAREHLNMRDLNKSQLSTVMRESGISFQEWVNFTVNGKFDLQSGNDT